MNNGTTTTTTMMTGESITLRSQGMSICPGRSMYKGPQVVEPHISKKCQLEGSYQVAKLKHIYDICVYYIYIIIYHYISLYIIIYHKYPKLANRPHFGDQWGKYSLATSSYAKSN